MAYGEIPLEWYTEQGREVPGPTYHASDMGDWDDDDREAAKAAMDNHVHAENRRLQAENDRLREHVERLSMSMPEHLMTMASQSPEERRAYRRS